MKDDADSGGESSDDACLVPMKRVSTEGLPELKKPRLCTPAKMTAEVNKPIEKTHCDAIANFLLRLACQVLSPGIRPEWSR